VLRSFSPRLGDPERRPATIARRWRIGGLITGTLAGTLLVVVGCTNVTSGTAVVDAKAAPSYRASVQASLSESAASSSMRMTTEAVHSACDALSTGSVDAINAVNAFVGAVNNGGRGGPDAKSKEGPAVDALNHSADLVSGSVSNVLAPPLHDALTAYADAARGVAQAITGNVSTDDFNAAIQKFNDSRTNAINLCDAAY
jgi:hypothetical protein